MANKQPQIVTVDNIEYNVEDMTEEQIALVNHVADLDRKIGSTKFQLDQLEVGRSAFFGLLKQALGAEKTPVEE